jgi:hypothetical protein
MRLASRSAVIRLALVLILLLVTASAQIGKHRAVFTPNAATVFVQGINCFKNYNSDLFCSRAFNSDVTAGNLLIAICGSFAGQFSNPIGTQSVSDSQGNTWTQQIDTGVNGNYLTGDETESWLFTAVAGSSGPDTVTCTTNAGHPTSYKDVFYEYSPAVTTVDGTPAGAHNATGTTGVTNVVTTTTTNVLFTYAYVLTGTASVSTPSGFTLDFTDPDSNIWLFRKNNVASGVQSVKLVSTDSNPIHAGLIALH